MDTYKKIINYALVFFAFIGALLIGFYIYYFAFLDTTTIGVNYISDQLALDVVEILNSEDMTDEEIDEYEERWFMEANYYSNDAENGIEVQELNFNYFTDEMLTSSTYRATGMQYLGDYENTKYYYDSSDEAQSAVVDGFYYYETTDGISWIGNNLSTVLNSYTSFIIKIDNEPYLIKLDKYYTTGWWIFAKNTYYDWGNVFADSMNAIETNSKGYGEYYITLDLSNYFTVYKYDNEDGSFSIESADIIKNYAVLKFSYYENGLISSSQSIFNLIEGDKTYGVEEDVNSDYWKAVLNYEITNEYLDLRYSATNNGYYIYINNDFANTLNSYSNISINITIDITDTEIIGIDFNGFSAININSLTILGSGDFTILESGVGSLNTLSLSENIDLILNNGAITDSDYSEVII